MLRVYVGAWQVGGKLRAQLDDGSTATYVEDIAVGCTHEEWAQSTLGINAVYTLRFKSAQQGAVLTVEWLPNATEDDEGNITFQAVALAFA
jgi:hypothetical protein